jgi:aminoglycoside phosphotransferase (APT) family kinase protein
MKPAEPGADAVRRVLREVDPQLRPRRAYALTGGQYAQVTAVEAVRGDGVPAAFVLRQYFATDAAGRPYSADAEYKLLAMLHAAGLRVPRPWYASDSGGGLLPGPFLVVEFIDGTPAIEPPGPPALADQLAGALASLHQAGFSPADAAYLPDHDDFCSHRLGTEPPIPDAALSEAAIRAALRPAWPPPQLNESAVLHGDFWPGNTLWRDGRLVAIIDWEDAAFGDPLADLCNARLELAMLFGASATDAFTWQYRTRMPGIDVSALPYWDLFAALRPAGKMTGWNLSPGKLAAMRTAHRRFVAGALAQFQSR